MAAKAEKLSVALAKEDVAWARKRAKKEGVSLSAVLRAAIRETREREAEAARNLAEFDKVVRLLRKGRRFSAKERRDARRELDSA